MSVALSDRPDAESAPLCAHLELLRRPMGVPYDGWSVGVCSALLIVMASTATSVGGWTLEFYLPTLVASGAAWLWIAIVYSDGALRTMAERMDEISGKPIPSRSWLNTFGRPGTRHPREVLGCHFARAQIAPLSPSTPDAIGLSSDSTGTRQ